jgi:acyl-coenzyme A synthetase/AMP-(fatty) acid ligase
MVHASIVAPSNCWGATGGVMVLVMQGLYLTGDGARRDEKGLWTITG